MEGMEEDIPAQPDPRMTTRSRASCWSLLVVAGKDRDVVNVLRGRKLRLRCGHDDLVLGREMSFEQVRILTALLDACIVVSKPV